jgi:hypothetical protein
MKFGSCIDRLIPRTLDFLRHTHRSRATLVNLVLDGTKTMTADRSGERLPLANVHAPGFAGAALASVSCRRVFLALSGMGSAAGRDRKNKEISLRSENR